MTRQGGASLMVLAALAIAALVISGDAASLSARLRGDGARLRRIEAREMALGAASLPIGGELQVGPWRLRRGSGDHAGRFEAAGPSGTYGIEATGERWLPASHVR